VNEDATLTVTAANGVLAGDGDGADADDQSTLHVTSPGALAGTRAGTLATASNSSYSYDPRGIANLENAPFLLPKN
jgi:hypothetical protein